MEEIIEEDTDGEGGEGEELSDGRDETSKSESEAGRLFDLMPLYEELEQGYDRAVEEMRERGEDLVKFFREYKRMWEVLYLYQDNEKKLLKKNRELEEQVSNSTSKVAATLKLAETDKQKVEELRKELESARKMVDVAHAREHAAQEIIENLRNQVGRLNKEIGKKSRRDPNQDSELSSVGKTRDSLVKERDRLFKEVSSLKERLNTATQYQEELERKNSSADVRIEQLMGEVENKATEVAKESLAKERLELEITGMINQLSNKEAELTSIGKELQETRMLVKDLDKSVKEHRVSNDKLSQEIDTMTGKLNILQQERDTLGTEVERLTKELTSKTAIIRAKEDEIVSLQVKGKKMITLKTKCDKMLKREEQKLTEALKEKDKLQLEIKTLSHELDLERKRAYADSQTIENLKREKEILNKNITRAADNSRKQEQKLKTQEQVKSNLDQLIGDCMLEASKQRNVISNIEKERDRYIAQSTELSQNVEDAMDDLKLKHMEIFEYKKKIVEADTKLKQQQELFETVRADRNTFSKNLLEAQDEISELKQKLKIMTHQIEQLKEDISTKETQIMKDEFVLQKTEKERENIRIELQQVSQELVNCRHDAQDLRQEEKRLQKVIQDLDEKNKRLQKDMEQIINERDILGTQLVQRNDKLSILSEKTNILQGTLEKGEAQYEQRLEDIRLLKLEIKKLRQEKSLLSRSITNMADLKQEVFQLERDLTKERIKCRALEEELQTPMNVHRWRKLEGTDPNTYELLKKVQLLQKRILAQSSEGIERENKLQEMRKLYENLCQLLARQPGPETVTRLQKTQSALRDRGRKMKCLITELNMFESQAAEYKFDLDRLNKEMKQIKTKYYQQKRREEKRREESAPPVVNRPENNKAQFTGGGFNLNAVPNKLQLKDKEKAS